MTYKEAIIADLKKYEDLDDPLYLLERLRKYDFGYLYHRKNGIRDRFETEYCAYKEDINEFYSMYIDKYFDDMEGNENRFILANQLSEFAASFSPKKYDVLVRLGEHDMIYDDAIAALNTDREDIVNAQAIIALAQCYPIEDAQYKIQSFFNRSFKEAREYALRTRKYDYLGDNLNPDIYLALVHGISLLPKSVQGQLRNSVYEAYTFLSDEERSYDANQASGYMVLYLPIFDKKISLSPIKKAIEITGEHYQNNRFVHQTLYTKWMLEENGEEALEYLQAEENKDWPTFAIIALSDLDYKGALPIIGVMQKNCEDPVLNEVLIEAIHRLESQTEAPKIEDRMIWLHGVMTPTYRALTGESDNVFVKRTQEKQTVDDTVYETDDE